MRATVERPMEKFLGKPRERGEIIGEDEMAQLSPQAMRSLAENGYLRVEGLAIGTNSGVEQHLRARVDAQDDRIKKLEASNAELKAMVADLMARLSQSDSAQPKRLRGRPRKEAAPAAQE